MYILNGLSKLIVEALDLFKKNEHKRKRNIRIKKEMQVLLKQLVMLGLPENRAQMLLVDIENCINLYRRSAQNDC